MKYRIYFLNDDSRLLASMRSGDENALIELFNRNKQQIMSLVMQNNGTKDDAEDVLQEALVVLWERVRDGSFEYKARLNTFIYAIAKNIWFRRLSHYGREFKRIDEKKELQSEEISVVDEIEKNERISAVQKAMREIGNPCHDILLLYYWEELSMDEIAKRLGFANADTVKAKKYQCKKILEKLVKKFLGEL